MTLIIVTGLEGPRFSVRGFYLARARLAGAGLVRAARAGLPAVGHACADQRAVLLKKLPNS